MSVFERLYDSVKLGIKKITFTDSLVALMVFFAAWIVSPYVLRQFSALKKIEDVLWNICYDACIVCAVILAAYMLARILNFINKKLDK